jgi:hypothetical protein
MRKSKKAVRSAIDTRKMRNGILIGSLQDAVDEMKERMKLFAPMLKALTKKLERCEKAWAKVVVKITKRK